MYRRQGSRPSPRNRNAKGQNGCLRRPYIKEARAKGYDVVIIDTAGRLAIDEMMMQEITAIKNWQDFGWSAVIYIAALSNVDPVHHEAAMIDGATRFQRVIHVDIPAIMPMISLMLIMSIGGLMGVGHEKALLMQTDGNLAVSELIATYVYKRGLTGVPDQAYATAIGLFSSVINVILLIIANTTSKRFSENSLW